MSLSGDRHDTLSCLFRGSRRFGESMRRVFFIITVREDAREARRGSGGKRKGAPYAQWFARFVTLEDTESV